MVSENWLLESTTYKNSSVYISKGSGTKSVAHNFVHNVLIATKTCLNNPAGVSIFLHRCFSPAGIATWKTFLCL